MLPITFEARVKGSGRISTGWAALGRSTLVMEVASFIFAPSRVPLQHRHWAAACRLWLCKARAVWRRISGLHPPPRRLARGSVQDLSFRSCNGKNENKLRSSSRIYLSASNAHTPHAPPHFSDTPRPLETRASHAVHPCVCSSCLCLCRHHGRVHVPALAQAPENRRH